MEIGTIALNARNHGYAECHQARECQESFLSLIIPLEYTNIDNYKNWYLEALEVPSPASLTFFGRLCIGERRRAFELLHTPKLTCFVVVVSSPFALHICRCLELVNYIADQRWGPGRAYHSNTNQPYSIMLWSHSLAFEISYISLQTWKEGKESMLIANSTEEPIQPWWPHQNNILPQNGTGGQAVKWSKRVDLF